MTNYPEQPIDPPEYKPEDGSSDDWKEQRDLEALLNKIEYLEEMK